MSKYKKFLGIFFSLFFLWLALRKIDFYALPKTLSSLDPVYILLLIIAYTLEMLTRTHRWLIIQPKESLTFKYSFYGLIMTFFFNNILPARAGEFFKPFYFSQKGIAESGETLGAVVLERFFDGIMLLGLILISFQNFTGNDLLRKASIITAVFYSLILFGILLAIFKRNIFERIIKSIVYFFPRKIGDFLSNIALKFVDGLSTIKDLKRLIKILLSSSICWASSVLTMWLGFKAFGFTENFIQASFVLTVLSISSMIPASPGVLGIYEYFCIFTLSNVLGHTSEDGAAFSIVMHGIQYFYIVFLGLIIAFIEGITVKEFAPKTPNNEI